MAVVEYDGTDYAGFQIQKNKRTIQGEIERALTKVTQEEIRIVGAGRTDAGVHARGQVIAFRTTWRRSLEELQRALNAVLPRDIAVRELTPAAEDFHPRFGALSREYRYTI
ncbi:MAG TPA: tRNA pseudouridine(38-40) synthase TruA, partial [Anaerolineae bacterium]|nr:tRNA pseudouridine(38-40) synthase TruA [Anaerolineae bacterium]